MDVCVCVCVCVYMASAMFASLSLAGQTPDVLALLKGRFYGMGTFDLGTLSNLYVRTAFLISNIYDGCTIVAT